MVIRYAVSQLPTIVDGLYIFYYSYGADSWVQLSEPEGFIAAADEKAGEVDHFSLFVVLAKRAQVFSRLISLCRRSALIRSASWLVKVRKLKSVSPTKAECPVKRW
jgi:hypothetical protein